MSTCRICSNDKSGFIMNNKTVCMHCDELLFDLEIECEELELKKETPMKKETPNRTTITLNKK